MQATNSTKDVGIVIMLLLVGSPAAAAPAVSPTGLTYVGSIMPRHSGTTTTITVRTNLLSYCDDANDSFDDTLISFILQTPYGVFCTAGQGFCR